MKPRVYGEASVISYLSARNSRDLKVAARQQSSVELWDSPDRYEVVIAEVVISKASAEDARGSRTSAQTAESESRKE
jgi:hypothetical protein